MSEASDTQIPSPEELDRTLIVVQSKGRMALLLTCALVIGALFWAFLGSIPNTFEALTIYLNTQGFETLYSPVSGKIKTVYIELNQEVIQGEVLALVEGTQGETVAILSNLSGKIVDIFLKKKDPVTKEDPIFLVQKKLGELAFFSFVPIERGQQLKSKMEVYIKPESVDAQQYGSIQAKIDSVSPFVATPAELKSLLGSAVLIQHFTKNEPVVIVKVLPEKNPKTISGLKWTSGSGPDHTISPLAIGKALFILHSRHPISYVIPIWRMKKINYDVKQEVTAESV